MFRYGSPSSGQGPLCTAIARYLKHCKIQNDCMQGDIDVALIKEKMIRKLVKMASTIQKRLLKTLVRRVDIA